MNAKEKAEKMIAEHDWDTIVHYMHDCIREEIHANMGASCTVLEFLTLYLIADPNFKIN